MGQLVDALVIILYPIIVLGGLTYLGVRWTALILLVLTGRRFLAMILRDAKTSRLILFQAGLMALITGGAAASASETALRFAPFAVSLTFIALFGFSLKRTPIIERFARLQRPDLPAEHVAYCRQVTQIWVAVLAVNSALILAASLWADTTLWTVLVGPVSYSFLGIVFASEYLVRKRRFQEFNDKFFVDRLLKPWLKREVS